MSNFHSIFRKDLSLRNFGGHREVRIYCDGEDGATEMKIEESEDQAVSWDLRGLVSGQSL